VFLGEGSADEIAAGSGVDEKGSGDAVDQHLAGQQPLGVVASSGGVEREDGGGGWVDGVGCGRWRFGGLLFVAGGGGGGVGVGTGIGGIWGIGVRVWGLGIGVRVLG
jgi:hypothetical protein